MTKVGIFGATAYTSLELIKLLVKHPKVKISYLAVRREGHPKISEIFPALSNIIDLECSNMEEDIPEGIELIFMTLPPTVAMEYAPNFLKRGIKVVDFSADYRFKDKDIYEKWYLAEHRDPAGIKNAVYGLPEVFRNRIKEGVLVANPGCYSTSSILGLFPLVSMGIICLDDIIIDAKSGISGAGRESTETTHYCERNENIEAYKVGCHRHNPEIDHVLAQIINRQVSVLFTPHMIPMNRGILTTIYAKIRKNADISEITAAFEKSYSKEPFIRIRGGNAFPRVKDVINTNFCDIAFRLAGGRLIVISCIDNLIKGAAGQAVQNMNIMLGFDETEGLL